MTGFQVVLTSFLLPLSSEAASVPFWLTEIDAAFPLAEVCLMPDDMLGNTCAAFFLDEDGFEICLRDEMSGKIRCSSTYYLEHDEEDDFSLEKNDIKASYKVETFEQ